MGFTNWKVWLGIAISAIFLYFSMRDIDYSRLWQAIRAANAWYFPPAVLLIVLAFIARAWRWGHLLSPITTARFRNLFHCTTIAFMVNNIFPLRVGELVRAYLIGEREKISKISSFGTVIWERIFDGFSLVPFLAMLWFLPFSMPVWLKTGITMIYWLYALIFGTILSLILFRKPTQRLAEWVVRRLPAKLAQPAQNLLDILIKGIDVLRDPKRLIWLIWHTAVIASTVFFSIALLILAFFGTSLHWTVVPFLIVMLYLAVSIPSSPGAIGTFHGACVLGLNQFGIEQNAAFGFAVVAHFINYMTITGLGFGSLLAQNETLTTIREDAAREKEILSQEQAKA